MSYEKKYKQRVLQYHAEGHTQEETASLFGVSRSTIKDWKRREKAGESLDAKKRNRRPAKIFPEALSAYVSENPDAYLSEIAERFNCSAEAIRLALKKLKITRKKRQ